MWIILYNPIKMIAKVCGESRAPSPKEERPGFDFSAYSLIALFQVKKGIESEN